MLHSILAISVGASTGAVLRWTLGARFNHIIPTLPLGTLAANLIGGYLIGMAIEYFGSNPSLPPEWRLFVITGFLGGLTTFSTFSAEVVALMQRGQMIWAFGVVAVHLLGSLALTMAGIASVSLVR